MHSNRTNITGRNHLLPRERQMLYILRNYTRMQNERMELMGRVRYLEYLDETSHSDLLQRCKTLESDVNSKHKTIDKLLLKNGKYRKRIRLMAKTFKNAWDMIPDDIKKKINDCNSVDSHRLFCYNEDENV